MAKLCECCGNKIGFLSDDPIYLEDDKILCHKCSKPIKNDIIQLYYVKNKEEFEALEFAIVEKSKSLFNDKIMGDIYSFLKKRNVLMKFESSESDVAGVAQTEAEGHTENNVKDGKSTPIESSGMFSNIGGKIKTLAMVLTCIGIIASVSAGISMLATGDEDLVLIGILIAAFGSIVSWVSSFVLYGFGQLIENTDELVKNSKKQ